MPYATLVPASTLAAHLDGSWAVLDCRFDLKDEGWGRAQYRDAHIPGAVYVSLAGDMSAPPSGSNGRHPLPEPDAMIATFSRLGIASDTQVVLYDQANGMYASRFWWMLRYMGHDAAAVLDGGWAAWIREGLPTRGGDERRAPATFVGQPRRELGLRVADVEPIVGSDATLLVDARAPERFEGRTEPIDRVAGHIPGAVNHAFASNVAENGMMLPVEVLRSQFQTTLGDRSPSQVVMYCGSGVTACQNLLAMEHAGLGGARLYPGSWSEWSSDPARPVEQGPSRRT